jgi:carboxyl-terminal processing protease
LVDVGVFRVTCLLPAQEPSFDCGVAILPVYSCGRRCEMSIGRILLTASALAACWNAAAQLVTSIEPTRAILETPAWLEFRALLDEFYVEPVSEPALQEHCLTAAKQQSVTPVSDAVALEGCLAAAAASLRYSTEYLSIAQLQELDAASAQKFVGVGLEITQEDGWAKIVKAIAGSPAERIGLRPGDLIVNVEGTTTRYMALREVVQRMRGEEGTVLHLVVNRLGWSEPLHVAVERAPIRPRAVLSALLAPGVGYLRIAQFRSETPAQVIEEVNKIRWSSRVAATAVPTQRLVLDLRNCPGGLVDALVDVSSLFVAPGTPVLHVEGRAAATTHTEFSTDAPLRKASREPPDAYDGALRRWRLVVLVNQATAAGAESLAVMLRQHRNAKLIGQRTNGFGVIQTVRRISSGGAIRIATGRMTVPSAASWHSAGVQPDLEVMAPPGPYELGDITRDAQLQAAVAALSLPPR